MTFGRGGATEFAQAFFRITEGYLVTNPTTGEFTSPQTVTQLVYNKPFHAEHPSLPSSTSMTPTQESKKTK